MDIFNRSRELRMELRSGIPQRKRAVKSALSVGTILIGVTLFNFHGIQNLLNGGIFYKNQIYTLSITLIAAAGFLLIASSMGMWKNLSWGETMAKTGIICAIAGIALFPIELINHINALTGYHGQDPDFLTMGIAIVGGGLVAFQFIIPLAPSIGYLSRLKKQRLSQSQSGSVLES